MVSYLAFTSILPWVTNLCEGRSKVILRILHKSSFAPSRVHPNRRRADRLFPAQADASRTMRHHRIDSVRLADPNYHSVSPTLRSAPLHTRTGLPDLLCTPRFALFRL